MTRGMRNKTRVHNVDFPFLSCRSNRKVTRSLIAAHFRTLKGYKSLLSDEEWEDWVERLKKFINEPFFFGYMTMEELTEQFFHLPHNHYFVCFSKGSSTFFTVWSNVGGNVHRVNVETLSHLPMLLVPLLRENGLIFKKKVERRARRAIECWQIIAKRKRVVRDIRILIAKRVWENRREWMI